MIGGIKSARSRRIAAIALLAAALVVVAAVITLPVYFVHDHYDAEIVKMQRQLKGFMALSRQQPQFVEAIDLLKSRDSRKFFLKGVSPALASAELQDVVKSVVDSSGGRVLSVQVLPPGDEAGYRRIGATIQISTNIQSLRRTLYALEAKEPYLFIDGLIVRAQVPSNFKPSPGVEPDMFCQFDVIGYALSAPKSASAASITQTNLGAAKP